MEAMERKEQSILEREIECQRLCTIFKGFQSLHLFNNKPNTFFVVFIKKEVTSGLHKYQ